MLNDLNLWRAQIGTFPGNSKYASFSKKKMINSGFHLVMAIFLNKILSIFICLFSIYISLTFYIVFNPLLCLSIIIFYYQYIFISYFLLICGDIEPKHGDVNKDHLSISHWKLIQYQLITLLNFRYCNHLTQSINLILYVFLNLFLILLFLVVIHL